MAFDGGFLKKTVAELKEAIDCHIDKIYQPTRDELVFLLRKKGFVKRLLVTVKNGSARINFTENKYENPDVPPNFCMLLRKYLSSARLTDITQSGLERVTELVFSATNELGDTVKLSLVCELIGNQANVILLREDRTIIDALRHSDVETAQRYILPGAVYEYPKKLEKLDPFKIDIKAFSDELLKTEGELWKNIINRLDGFSPLVCREIEHRVNCKEQLYDVLCDVLSYLTTKSKAVMIMKPDGTPLEFSYIDINQYGVEYKKREFNSFSELLDAFYTEKDTAARIASSAHDIIRLVNNLKSRTEKKLALRLNELKQCENRETFRIYGELLKANLYRIENGSKFAVVSNYYDENMADVKIPLNPALSPAKNAEKYFKDYKKTYTAEQTLTALTEQDRQELVYFDSVLDSISRSVTLAEISEIREELADAGYLRKAVAGKKKKQQNSALKEEISREGYRILIGKNNTQNDLITTRMAAKNDLWFHVKNIPGSHVVVFCEGGAVSEETVLKVARLAAQNSKAATSSQVPVDYTYIKNVKKPNGAKPGMVIYTTNKTVYVNPSKEEL